MLGVSHGYFGWVKSGDRGAGTSKRDMSSTAVIAKCRFAEPKRNLPTHVSRRTTPEDRFTLAFAKAYQDTLVAIHRGSIKHTVALVREIPVNGYGITDLLAICWSGLPDEHFPDVRSFVEVAKPTCRAFEMKLTNWQKALSQASRYRNFSHQAVVVLPPATCRLAVRAIETFKLVRVGLWSFDPKSNRIQTFYTPRPHIPRSNRYWLESIEKAARSSRSTLPIR